MLDGTAPRSIDMGVAVERETPVDVAIEPARSVRSGVPGTRTAPGVNIFVAARSVLGLRYANRATEPFKSLETE
jgi:hypothetical protein